MKKINIIGLVLIILIQTITNRIVPGRYCTYFNNDTIWAFGPTLKAENDKEGFWVYLGKSYPSNVLTLSSVATYKDNKLNG